MDDLELIASDSPHKVQLTSDTHAMDCTAVCEVACSIANTPQTYISLFSLCIPQFM